MRAMCEVWPRADGLDKRAVDREWGYHYLLNLRNRR